MIKFNDRHNRRKIMKCLYSKYDIAQLAINDALSFLLQFILLRLCNEIKKFLNIAVIQK